VDGGFVLPGERLTNHDTEQTLTDFSQRAQASKPQKTDTEETDRPADVLTSIEGLVKIRDGVVSSERLTFEIPGAAAKLNGSYDLRKGTVHLVGNLKMDSDISHVTTGFKSLLLKPLAPFFKKKDAGAVIPIAVTGGPDKFTVSQDLLHDK